MTKRGFRCAVSAVTMGVAVIPVAGCEASIDRWDTKLGGLLDSGFSSRTESVGGLAQVEKNISIEHRHYDIYTRYRAAFEDPTERIDVEWADSEGGMPVTGAADQGSDSTLPSCSVRALMAQE